MLAIFVIVKFRIHRTLYSGSVRKPNLPGDESVSLFLGFTINNRLFVESVVFAFSLDAFYFCINILRVVVKFSAVNV